MHLRASLCLSHQFHNMYSKQKRQVSFSGQFRVSAMIGIYTACTASANRIWKLYRNPPHRSLHHCTL